MTLVHARILLVLLTLVAAAAAGFFLGVDYEAGQQAKREQALAQARSEALAAAAKEIAKIDVKRVTIRAPLEREVHEKIVYRDCRNTPDGLRRLNQALGGDGAVDRGELPGDTGQTGGR